MKKLLAGLLFACCGSVYAQSTDELVADGKNTENVLTFGMGYDLKMYSPLKQINKSNVTIPSGRGGSNPTRSAGELIPSGGSVVTFALLPE